MQNPIDNTWALFLLSVLWLLIGWAIGYVRGREDGRAAERREVRFTPVDKLEPPSSYRQTRYCPPLKPVEKKVTPILQGVTKRGDAYRYYDLKDL